MSARFLWDCRLLNHTRLRLHCPTQFSVHGRKPDYTAGVMLDTLPPADSLRTMRLALMQELERTERLEQAWLTCEHDQVDAMCVSCSNYTGWGVVEAAQRLEDAALDVTTALAARRLSRQESRHIS